VTLGAWPTTLHQLLGKCSPPSKAQVRPTDRLQVYTATRATALRGDGDCMTSYGETRWDWYSAFSPRWPVYIGSLLRFTIARSALAEVASCCLSCNRIVQKIRPYWVLTEIELILTLAAMYVSAPPFQFRCCLVAFITSASGPSDYLTRQGDRKGNGM